MLDTVAIWVALAAFLAGAVLKSSAWFRRSFEPGGPSPLARAGAALRGIAGAIFGARIGALARSLVLDVVLQRRILKEGRARWIAHLLVSASFVALLLLHALGGVLTVRLFPGYQPTLDPFLALRDLLGVALLAGLAIAAWRRWGQRVPRRTTRRSDSYALGILAVVAISGVLLQAVKVGSYARFQGMAREWASEADEAPLAAYWAREMGTVSPRGDATPALVEAGRRIHEESCAGCHSRPRSGVVSFAAAAALRPLSPRLDAVNAAGILRAVHLYACLLGLAVLPFTKLFHVLATPLALVAGAAARKGGSPANAMTRQMLALDACTHCCTCSAHCSMAMASDAFRNDRVLPSEKIAALRALASGRDLGREELRLLREGVVLCTSCERCTVSCPSGIDLVALWTSAKEALLARGEPAWALLSPLSLRRRLRKGEIGPAAYQEPVDRPRRAIAEREGFAAASDRSAPLAPGDGRLGSALRRSIQASTLAECFGCKTCTTACPVVRSLEAPEKALGLLPHQVLYSVRLGLWGLVLGSNMLWDCLGCYQCQEHCPQGVGVTDVLYELKNVAIARAAAAAAEGGGARP